MTTPADSAKAKLREAALDGVVMPSLIEKEDEADPPANVKPASKRWVFPDNFG